ncbi:hypothetical protein ATO8_07031 [Roseivivax marinus]|uniref:TRAP transporter small permease protein n=1 Tax=Roseivivax marinus TaxID=1379903 RepID=W4HMW9_9RHOB|nr:TRAP transporter small permease [Roseivivax marinus]ETW13763.1 hypothetical protein ATO8_07031 [Roseivivax marinus]
MAHDTGSGAASGGPLFTWLARTVAVIGGATLAGLVLLVCAEVFMRAVLNDSLDVVEELAGYGVVLLTFFGASLALRRDALFRVEFLANALPRKVLRTLTALFVCASIVACAILAWKCFGTVQSSFSRGKFAPTVLETPLWIPQLILPIGFALLVVFLVEKLLILARGPKETS